ncbi:pilin [Aquimonas sp.]|jgi:Tfp pilus assembly major pilin PilA|uniref:pilin n=1 Tax=Aquimonas sp. TaxID=1872588 RepID=UPI0037C1B26B
MRIRLLACALVATLSACSSDPAAVPTPSVPMASAAEIAEASAHPPWLRERLPADTIAYARVPSLWGVLAAPSGRAGDAMHSNQAAVDAVLALRKAFISDALMLKLGDGPLQLIEASASPIELAVVAPGKAASPAASALFSVRLKAADAAAAAQLVNAATGGHLGALSFDDAGNASLDAGGTPLYLHYRADQQRLFVLAGMFANEEQLKLLISKVGAAKDTHVMRGLERRIDDGGQGGVLWFDMVAARPLLLSALPPEHAWLSPTLEGAKALALGWGHSDGHGSLALRIEFEQATPWAGLLPSGPHRFDATAAGDPDWVLTGVLPGVAESRALFDVVQAQQASAADADAFAEIEAELQKRSGLSFAQWRAPWAGPFVLAGDASGSWQALKLADRAALDVVVNNLVERLGAKHAVHSHAGVELHHLQLPSSTDLMKTLGGADAQTPALPTSDWLSLYGRVRTHLYYYEDGGWLYVSTLPQPLIERLDRNADTDVGQWLERTQGNDRAQALLSASSQLRHVSRSVYAVNLELLQSFSDLTGGSIDLFKLPTAQQLALPEQSPIGVELVLDSNQLALQLNYGHTPLEGLGAAGGMATVAAAGVLAAVALPAYEDYTQRTRVSAAISAARPLQAAIAEHYLSAGALPDDAGALGLPLPLRTDDDLVSIDFDGGAILIRFDDEGSIALAGEHLYLLPELDTRGQLIWSCGHAAHTSDAEALTELAAQVELASIESRRLPAQCR